MLNTLWFLYETVWLCFCHNRHVSVVKPSSTLSRTEHCYVSISWFSFSKFRSAFLSVWTSPPRKNTVSSLTLKFISITLIIGHLECYTCDWELGGFTLTYVLIFCAILMWSSIPQTSTWIWCCLVRWYLLIVFLLVFGTLLAANEFAYLLPLLPIRDWI